jgi:hypothetical protein
MRTIALTHIYHFSSTDIENVSFRGVCKGNFTTRIRLSAVAYLKNEMLISLLIFNSKLNDTHSLMQTICVATTAAVNKLRASGSWNDFISLTARLHVTTAALLALLRREF